MENEQALKQLARRLKMLDCLTVEEKHMQLILGILAGNVFDWGAKEVRNILETQQFTLEDAQKKLQSK